MNERMTSFVTTASSLTSQDWTHLSLGDDPSTMATPDFDIIVQRVTSLFVVRMVALVAPLGTFADDISVSSVCRSLLLKPELWPAAVSETVVEQLQKFMHSILHGYKDVPYHNVEHACHVILSVNKLTDMLVSTEHHASLMKVPPTYGLRHDPLALFAVLFAALVHDVEHQGIPNRQLASEDDRLAVLYNDQSIAENWSLYVAFSEFLQDEYATLRLVLFGNTSGPTNTAVKAQDNYAETYSRFRKIVINLVLMTDIASPERTQIGKSKWKEAFGEPFETVERKVRAQVRRMSLTGQNIEIRRNNGGSGTGVAASPSFDQRTKRRGTGDMSEIGMTDPVLQAKPSDIQGHDDDDDSLSVTPENSFHDEDDPQTFTSATQQLYPQMHRSSSLPARQKFERRLTAASSRTSPSTARYRQQRLGILRTVDLSGETLETYSTHARRNSTTNSTATHSEDGTTTSIDVDADEPNDLKASVVLEVIMTAADVAHNLQGWEQMVKWSNRLYLELRKAFVNQRGSDPQHRWFENQIGFLECYLLPLARKLEDTGMFSEGPQFSQIVETNRDRWLTEGYDVAQKTIQEGETKYPAIADVN